MITVVLRSYGESHGCEIYPISKRIMAVVEAVSYFYSNFYNKATFTVNFSVTRLRGRLYVLNFAIDGLWLKICIILTTNNVINTFEIPI